MAHGGYDAPEYFTEHFQGNNVDYNAIKAGLHAAIGGFAGKSETEIAQDIKRYFLEKGIKSKTNKQGSSGIPRHTSNDDDTHVRSGYAARNASGNVNITINENKGLSFLDWFLLQSFFGSKTTIIHTNPAATYSAPPQEKKDESGKGKANVFIFFAALCVITHLAVCALYHMYFKKEAEKSDKPIDYLANRQLGIAIFQLAFCIASLIGGGACINQSEIFFPLLINTFICLFSACLFYGEYNKTLEADKPYLKLAKLIIDDERLENQRTRQSTYSTGQPGATHYAPPPPYFTNASAPPAYDSSGLYPNVSGQLNDTNVTGFSGHSK